MVCRNQIVGSGVFTKARCLSCATLGTERHFCSHQLFCAFACNRQLRLNLCRKRPRQKDCNCSTRCRPLSAGWRKLLLFGTTKKWCWQEPGTATALSRRKYASELAGCGAQTCFVWTRLALAIHTSSILTVTQAPGGKFCRI